ncbi:MAG TPA: transporter substrate-binding domain-containing protein [Bacteroidetes bacterium]|nr:transporter substrate-binding domain-containing protein [Bacteroidota bacterium]
MKTIIELINIKMSKIFILLILSSFFLSNCTVDQNKKVVVDFKNNSSLDSTFEKQDSSPVYIAIASMTSPRETFTYYGQLINYISDKLGKPILIKQKKTYEEVNDLLKKGLVDFAFICSGAYVELSRKKDVDLLVVPVINKKTYYQAYIISKNSDEINEFKDLENKYFAFTDPLSNTGHRYPMKLLKEMDTNERLFFSKTIYTYGHDISIHMVNSGVVDGASVHSLIYDYIAEAHPESVKNIKIIKKSEWFGIPPVVTSKKINAESFKRYRELFLSINEDTLGKSILKKLKIEKFVTINDSIYRNVRKLDAYVHGKKH